MASKEDFSSQGGIQGVWEDKKIFFVPRHWIASINQEYAEKPYFNIIKTLHSFIFFVDSFFLKFNFKTNIGKLARFFINILMILHSNCFVERMYSFVNIIKNPIRNQLAVESVSAILQIKSYYNEDDEFEPDEDHYFFYKHNIKDSDNKSENIIYD